MPAVPDNGPYPRPFGHGGYPDDEARKRADQLVMEATRLGLIWLAFSDPFGRPGVFLSNAAAEAVLARLSPFRGLAGASDAEVLAAAERIIPRYANTMSGAHVTLIRDFLAALAEQARDLDDTIPAAPWKREEWLANRVPDRLGRPVIACLCGSSRFYDQYQQAYYDLTMRGEIVLSVGFYPHATAEHGHGEGVGHDSAQKVTLDELHLRKIDLADYVLVVSDGGGYFGESTIREIRHAIRHGKPVAYLHPAAARLAVRLGLGREEVP
jgi:hypothetical protein